FTTLVSVASKILGVVIAERVVEEDIRSTTLAGIVGVVVFVTFRILSNGTRIDAHCDLERAMVRAIVESDVLTEPTPQPLRALYEPTFNASTLLSQTLPELAASVIAAVAVAPIVARALPARALVVACIALAVVMAALAALGRVSASVQRRVWDASQTVF